MRLEWLEDIIAVIETGSFSAAAERRFVTQPAFSRRIRAIEESLGTELFDRRRKPVVLKPSAAGFQEDFRKLANQMRDLENDLRRQGRETSDRLILASQHAITATLAPKLVDVLLQHHAIDIRLRSANRDECLALLMTKQVDLVLGYRSSSEFAQRKDDFVEQADLGSELFIPVFSSTRLDELKRQIAEGEIPVIHYPADAFLGEIFNDELLPRLGEGVFIQKKVETALSLAALEFAINGIGVAWLPENLARNALIDGRLTDLSDYLPSTQLAICALRLTREHTIKQNEWWDDITLRFAKSMRHGCPPD